MSVPFTITNDNWQTVAKLRELTDGFNERMLYPGKSYHRMWNGVDDWEGIQNSAHPVLLAGDDVQHYELYSYMQIDLINFCDIVVPGAYVGGEERPVRVQDLADDLGISAYHYFCRYIVGGNLYRSETDYGFRRSVDGISFVVNNGDSGVARANDYLTTGIANHGGHVFSDLADFMSGFGRFHAYYRVDNDGSNATDIRVTEFEEESGSGSDSISLQNAIDEALNTSTTDTSIPGINVGSARASASTTGTGESTTYHASFHRSNAKLTHFCEPEFAALNVSAKVYFDASNTGAGNTGSNYVFDISGNH